MRIIYVDDEQDAIFNFRYEVKALGYTDSIACFTDSLEALRFAQQATIDAAFLDIDMPLMNGLELSQKLRKIHPNIEVIFITAYDEYAFDSYKSGGRMYLTKPYDAEELQEAFVLLRKLVKAEESPAAPTAAEPATAEPQVPKVFLNTFGNFDVFLDGKVVPFANAKAKELLALLINHRGSSVSNVQVVSCLWEGKEYDSVTSSYVRRTSNALKVQLEELGLGDMVLFDRNAKRFNMAYHNCDFFDVMDGGGDYIFAYNGYYMSQYSWAEENTFMVEKRIKDQLNRFNK